MLAKDVMRREVFTVQEDQPVEAVIEVLVREHIQGVPVLDAEGRLVGVVTQQDVFFSSATAAEPGRGGSSLKVRDVMTSPAVSAAEQTEVRALCRMMERLRIHRIPIVADNRVTGIVSSLDVCALVARGELT